MKTIWDNYMEIRTRMLRNYTKDELIELVLEMEKLLGRISQKEEKGDLQ